MRGLELELKSRNVEGRGRELERGGRELESDGRVLPALTKDRRIEREKDRRGEGEKGRRREGRYSNHFALRPAGSTMPGDRFYLKKVGSETAHKMRGHVSRIPVSRSTLKKDAIKAAKPPKDS